MVLDEEDRDGEMNMVYDTPACLKTFWVLAQQLLRSDFCHSDVIKEECEAAVSLSVHCVCMPVQ